jgi:protease-4
MAFFLATSLFILILNYLWSFSSTKNESKNEKEFIYKEGNITSLNKIAILKLRGPILNEPSSLIEFEIIENFGAIYVSEVIKDLQELSNEQLKGIIISIDSPGGSVSATYKLYKALEKFKQNNEIIIFTHTNELLASGGYWVSLASDKIYANYGALIGSIGVRSADWIFYDTPVSISTGILGQSIETKEGIKKFNSIAGRSKDLFDPFRKPTSEELKVLKNIVNNIYIDFVNYVSNSRSIENQFVTNNLGALIFDATTAKKNYLIDDVINLEKVQERMVKELNLKDYKILQKKKTKISLLQKIIQSSLILKYDVDMVRKKEMCNLVDSQISVFYISNFLIKNC